MATPKTCELINLSKAGLELYDLIGVNCPKRAFEEWSDKGWKLGDGEVSKLRVTEYKGGLYTTSKWVRRALRRMGPRAEVQYWIRKTYHPVAVFVAERCIVAPFGGKDADYHVPSDALYAEWKYWCKMAGREPSSKQAFGRWMSQAFPTMKAKKLQVHGSRFYAYCGIKLRDTFTFKGVEIFYVPDMGQGDAKESPRLDNAGSFQSCYFGI